MPTPAAPPAPVLHALGTLRYTTGQLRGLFFWLLAGDVAFFIINQIEPVILPVILKKHGARDNQIALLLSSLPALIGLVVGTLVSYNSDRTRSRWGRRIPYLAVGTPFVSLLLVATAFAPELARSTGGSLILVFGLLIGFYQVFQAVIASVYFYLLRDVVPVALMGRFLSLMRIFGALAIFGLNYWLIGYAESHPREIFIGAALLNLAGFGLLCRFVREGEYEPVADRVARGPGLTRFAFIRSLVNFAVESFSHPVYRWTYCARLLVYACMPATGFIVLFARHELGLELAAAGRYLAWPSFAWIAFAYPVGRAMDRFGAIKVMQTGLVVIVAGYLASFFLITGPRSFVALTMVTGLSYWVVMLAQLMLAQVIFHPARMGQLSSASVLVQSLVIAGLTGPGSGWLLETLQGAPVTFTLPGVGSLAAGHYRFIYLFIGLLYAGALLSLFRVRHHWRKLGGPAAYVPPL